MYCPYVPLSQIASLPHVEVRFPDAAGTLRSLLLMLDTGACGADIMLHRCGGGVRRGQWMRLTPHKACSNLRAMQIHFVAQPGNEGDGTRLVIWGREGLVRLPCKQVGNRFIPGVDIRSS